MQPLTLDSSGVSDGSVTTIITPAVPNHHLFTALSIMAMDEDTAIATLIEIGIREGTINIPIDSTPGAFPAATSMTIYWACVLKPGQAFYAKFATPAAGDHLRLIAHGYVERLDPHEA
jgi:hypothetical protein